MNKKKIIAIIILIIGVILIGCGIFFGVGKDTSNNKNNSSNKNKPQDNEVKEPKEKPLSYEEAVEIIESLYAEEGYTLEVKEEESRFVINKKNDNGEITNTFYMDKQTGYFSEEAKSSTTVEPIQVG